MYIRMSRRPNLSGRVEFYCTYFLASQALKMIGSLSSFNVRTRTFYRKCRLKARYSQKRMNNFGIMVLNLKIKITKSVIILHNHILLKHINKNTNKLCINTRINKFVSLPIHKRVSNILKLQFVTAHSVHKVDNQCNLIRIVHLK